MVEFLQRKRGDGFSKVTLLYPDEYVKGESPVLRILDGGVEELRFSLKPLRGAHPGIEPGYAAARILSYFRRKWLNYDYCVAADLTGWQIAYPLRLLGHISHLTYDDQDYFPRVIESPYGRIVSAGLEKLIAKTADMIISASETLAELRRRQGARLVHVIPNGVDPSFFSLKDRDPRNRLQRRRVFYAGHLGRDYGIGILLEAFSRVRDATGGILLLAGTGLMSKGMRRSLERSVFESAVQLLGRVEHGKLGEVMMSVTVGVAPYLKGSSAEYGVPMKIKEYLAVGLPVVATNVGEIPRFLNGKHVGVVINPDVGELAEALIRMLSLEPSEYSRMSSAARELAADYSWDTLYYEYFRILRGVSS